MAGDWTGPGPYAALCGRLRFELLSNPRMTASHFAGNGKANANEGQSVFYSSAPVVWGRPYCSFCSIPQGIVTHLQALPAYPTLPPLGRTEWSSGQPSTILLPDGGKEGCVSCWVCCLLALSPQVSGVLGFHPYKGLLLGSRRNTDEMAKEWGAVGFQGHHAGFGLTLAFADYQPGPSPL